MEQTVQLVSFCTHLVDIPTSISEKNKQTKKTVLAYALQSLFLLAFYSEDNYLFSFLRTRLKRQILLLFSIMESKQQQDKGDFLYFCISVFFFFFPHEFICRCCGIQIQSILHFHSCPITSYPTNKATSHWMTLRHWSVLIALFVKTSSSSFVIFFLQNTNCKMLRFAL